MFIQDFANSILAYGKALALIKELKLWKFFLIPTAIGLLIGSLIISFAYLSSHSIGLKIASFWTFEFGKDFIKTASEWIGFFFVLIVGISTYKHILMALSAPFMTPISEKIEEHLTGKVTNSTSFFNLLLRGIKINIRNLFFELLYSTPLMILSFIPFLNVITTFLIFYIQSYYSGFGNMDYTMERYFNYSKSIDFVKHNKGTAVGNGLLFTLILFIPVVGIIIALPLSTVASSLSTLNKIDSGHFHELAPASK